MRDMVGEERRRGVRVGEIVPFAARTDMTDIPVRKGDQIQSRIR